MATGSAPSGPVLSGTAILVTHESTGVDETGIIGPFLADLGMTVVRHEMFPTNRFDDPAAANLDFPDPAGAALVVVFGSGAHAHDPRIAPWFDAEVEWVRSVLAAGIPFVGICFGSQVLATALGGRVAPTGSVEAGMLTFPTTPDCPLPAGPWFSWHSDIVELPDGVTLWSHNEVGPQMYTTGAALGLQFHPEVDGVLARSWIEDDPGGLPESMPPARYLAEVAKHEDASTSGCRDLIVWALTELPGRAAA